MSNMDVARAKAEKLLSSEGYVTAGKAKKIAEDAVHKHEQNMHAAKKPTKFKCGGTVKGEAAKERLDKRARGGKNAAKTHINVIVAGGAKPQSGMGAADSAAPMPPPSRPAAPMPPPPQGMPPQGLPPQAGMGAGAPGMPPKPPGMMNKGGKVKGEVHKDKSGNFQNKTGGGGAKARLAKEANEKRKGF